VFRTGGNIERNSLEESMAFFKLKSAEPAEQAKTGNAIIKVSNSVFQFGPDSEWAKFDKDTRKWLFDNGYLYLGTPDGKVPANIDIIPVYDTPGKMHIRVPWHGDLENAPAPQTESYGGSFPVFLAHYFVRKCR
jgi:hypothetical protein